MSETRDPTRWRRGGPSAPDGFKQLARADQARGPSEAQLAAMMQGLSREVARPELADAYRAHAEAAGASVGGGALIAKLGAGAVVLGLAAAALWWPRAQPGERAQARPAATAAQAAAASPRTEVVESPRAEQPPPLAAAAGVPGADSAGARAEAPAKSSARPAARKSATRDGSGDPGDELALLEQAQRALRDDPRRALSLAGSHRVRFARGQFVQEREMLAIEALLRLGREREARRRAAAFEQRHPQSSHLPRLHDMVRASR